MNKRRSFQGAPGLLGLIKIANNPAVKRKEEKAGVSREGETNSVMVTLQRPWTAAKKGDEKESCLTNLAKKEKQLKNRTGHRRGGKA